MITDEKEEEEKELQVLRLGIILGGLALISAIPVVMDAVQFLVLRVLLGSSGGSADFSIFRESFGWTFSSNIRAAEAAALDAAAEEF